MRFNSPLRYPGGKGKLSFFFKCIFEKNNLYDAEYVEPYAGGAGIALELLFNEYVSKIHLNDLNKSIYAFWYALLNHTDKLCRLIYDTPVNIDEWHKQKAIQENARTEDKLKLGFSTFYLNRTNRSGIINGGVIGGFKQNGKWKIDARFRKKDLVSRIDKIALYKNRIKLYNLDASALITNIVPKLSKNSLIYLDPPYYKKGKELYENHYKHEDHTKIQKVISSKIKQKWIVSYDNVSEIKKLYSQYRQITYSLNYSAGKKYKGSEVIIFCDRLIIPKIENPIKLKIS